MCSLFVTVGLSGWIHQAYGYLSSTDVACRRNICDIFVSILIFDQTISQPVANCGLVSVVMPSFVAVKTPPPMPDVMSSLWIVKFDEKNLIILKALKSLFPDLSQI